jgi:hypothetical protein
MIRPISLSEASRFMLTHARLLERLLFQVCVSGAEPALVGQAVRAYRNPDGGLGHALEPDLRCPESQPLFVEFGLGALQEAGWRDAELALAACHFLESVAAEDALVPPLLESAFGWPHASHWSLAAVLRSKSAPGLNPSLGLCGLLHYQGVWHPWLARLTQTCCERLLQEPPREAHTLLGATRLVDSLPDRALAGRLFDQVAAALPQASFFIAEAPVQGYGLTPLHFAPRPDSPWRALFTSRQIEDHLADLAGRQLPDGGWPISWEPPGPAAALEWRGRWTLEACRVLAAYGALL